MWISKKQLNQRFDDIEERVAIACRALDGTTMIEAQAAWTAVQYARYEFGCLD